MTTPNHGLDGTALGPVGVKDDGQVIRQHGPDVVVLPEVTPTMRVIRATEIARLAMGDPGGDPEMAIFGRILEEELTYEAHLRSRHVFRSKRPFIRKVAMAVREAGLPREFVRDAWCIEATLRRAGLLNYRGKPRTEFRTHPTTAGILIAGQPDLLGGYRDYMEFTLAGVTPYQRAKTAVMAYACDEPVRLVGLRRDGHRWDFDEVEMTPEEGQNIMLGVPATLLATAGTVQHVCEDCGLPRCECPPDWDPWEDDHWDD